MNIFYFLTYLKWYLSYFFNPIIELLPAIKGPPMVPLVTYESNPFPYQPEGVTISPLNPYQSNPLPYQSIDVNISLYRSNPFPYQPKGVTISPQLITPVVKKNTQLAIFVPQESGNLYMIAFEVCISVVIFCALLKWKKRVWAVQTGQKKEAPINERYLVDSTKDETEDLMRNERIATNRHLNPSSHVPTSSHGVSQLAPFGINQETEQNLENMSPSTYDILTLIPSEYIPAEQEDEFLSVCSIFEELETDDIAVPNVLIVIDGIENRLEEVEGEAGSVSARSFTSQEYISFEQSIDELELEEPPLNKSEDIEMRSEQPNEGDSVSGKHLTSERLLLDKESGKQIIEDIPLGGSEQKHIISQGILSDEKSCDDPEIMGIIQLKGSKDIEARSEQKENNDLLLGKSFVSHGFLSAEEFCEQQVTKDMSIIGGSEVLEESLASHLSDQEDENGLTSEEPFGVPGLSSHGDSHEELQTMDVSLREGSENIMQISDDLKDDPISGDDPIFLAQGALSTDEGELQSKNNDATNFSGCEFVLERDNIDRNNEIAEDNPCDVDADVSLNREIGHEIIPETINCDRTVKLVLYTPDGHPYELNCTMVPDA